MSTTRKFCERIAGLSEAEVTAPVRVLARQLVLDGLAIAIAGTSEPAIRMLSAHYQAQGGVPAASAIGLGFRLPPVAAAALNGAAMHVLDFEPMWSPANHALSTTLPAALAVAEQRGATGLDLLTALVKGCEAQGWLREASGQYEPRGLVFHPPGVVGPIGAAVAAGHLLGLDAARLAHAVGMAASRSGTLLANVGTMTKSLHCGNAAVGRTGGRAAGRTGVHGKSKRVGGNARPGGRIFPRQLPPGRTAAGRARRSASLSRASRSRCSPASTAPISPSTRRCGCTNALMHLTRSGE